MSYSTGEAPMVGDTVSDDTDRLGNVAYIVYYGAAVPELVIHWNDGTIGIRYYATGVSLIERAATETISLS